MNAKIWDELRDMLIRAHTDAIRVHDTNKKNGSSVQSVAYDSGRAGGLEEALECMARIEWNHGKR